MFFLILKKKLRPRELKQIAQGYKAKNNGIGAEKYEREKSFLC